MNSVPFNCSLKVTTWGKSMDVAIDLGDGDYFDFANVSDSVIVVSKAFVSPGVYYIRAYGSKDYLFEVHMITILDGKFIFKYIPGFSANILLIFLR